MTVFFKKHPEVLLAILAVIFIGLIISYFTWGINNVVANITMALQFTIKGSSPGFNLQTAAKLDYRGIIDTSTIGQ